jgi:hypothetical protein
MDFLPGRRLLLGARVVFVTDLRMPGGDVDPGRAPVDPDHSGDLLRGLRSGTVRMDPA